MSRQDAQKWPRFDLLVQWAPGEPFGRGRRTSRHQYWAARREWAVAAENLLRYTEKEKTPWIFDNLHVLL